MGILEELKTAVKIVQQMDNIDLQKKLLDVQSQALEIVEQNGHLRTRVRELEQALDLRESITHRENFIWLKGEGPYCQHCWDSAGKLIRCQDFGERELGKRAIGCARCGIAMWSDGSAMPQSSAARVRMEMAWTKDRLR